MASAPRRSGGGDTGAGEPSRTGTDALRSFVGRIAPSDRATERIDQAAAEALAAFDERGVDALLLKGRPLGALLYEAGERAGYGDVDLLVAPQHLDVAEQALTQLGYSNRDTNRGIDDIGGIVHAQPWIRTGRGPLDVTVIDLHWRLPGSRVAPAVAWEALSSRRTWIEVGGRPAAALDRCGQALHLAVHAAQHGHGAARTLEELSLALERWPEDVWACAAGLAQQLDATPAFAAGLRLLAEGAAVAAELNLPPTPELDWTIRNRVERPRGALHLHALAELDGLRERLQFVRRSLLPPRSWIVQEYRWARAGGPPIIAAYAVHLARLPVWAARAWRHRQRARHAAPGNPESN